MNTSAQNPGPAPDSTDKQQSGDSPPLQSPIPHSDIVRRDGPDSPAEGGEHGGISSPKAAHDAAGPDSVAGEEDPGAGLGEQD